MKRDYGIKFVQKFLILTRKVFLGHNGLPRISNFWPMYDDSLLGKDIWFFLQFLSSLLFQCSKE